MSEFNLHCRRCQRLASFMDDIKETHPDYHCRPVPAFGDDTPEILIVGLAPGMHGANATGRPFTGDYAGVLLYETIYNMGFSNRPKSLSKDDGLLLNGCRITNAVKCLPPENKPTTDEIKNCNDYFLQELNDLPEHAVLLALGSIAHNAVLRALGLKLSRYKFAHEAEHQLPNGRWMIDSYHCSRYNTQTKRLTTQMFESVFAKAKARSESVRHVGI